VVWDLEPVVDWIMRSVIGAQNLAARGEPDSKATRRISDLEDQARAI
jgi:hypothetical protein